MIALIKNKKPILGVIGWPTEKTLFVAQKGSGAFRYSNDKWKKMSVTKVAELSNVELLDQDIIYQIKKNHLSKN